MGTEIETRMTEHMVNQFWGGANRGMCLQVTASCPLTTFETAAEQRVQQEGFVQLTMEEASALCDNLGQFVKREAVRRQGLLREQIEALGISARTVFNEVADIPSDVLLWPSLAVAMVSRFCPKARPEVDAPADTTNNTEGS